MQSDSKIFREVNALSRLSHRFIVRYYTTWVEISEQGARTSSDISGSDSGTENGMTSVPTSRSTASSGRISFDIGDLDDIPGDKSSFPSIHFDTSGPLEPVSDESDDEFDDLFGPEHRVEPRMASPRPSIARILYIQMVI
jgi:eukaryotic translation initiation factor 2-alpha kinase 4